MSSPSSVARPLFLGIGLLVLAACSIQGIRIYFEDRNLFPPDDFVEYWSAGRLNAFDQNPYDPDLLHPLQKDAGRFDTEATMMWNPPWTLTLVMPFGLLPPRLAQLLWQILSMGLVLVSADWLWQIYDGPPRLRWLAWLLALTYLPTIFVIQSGQIGAFILFGGGAFLGLLRHKMYWAAGAVTVLLAIKPHLVYLFWVVLIVYNLRYQRRVLWGGLIVGLVVSLIPLVTHPSVYYDYWDAMAHRPPAQWRSPTLGTALRLMTDDRSFRRQFVPSTLGIIWLLAWGRQRRNETFNWVDALPALLLVSFVTASYGAWPFDLVILLPAVIQRAAQISNRQDRGTAMLGLCLYVSINLAALLLNLARIESYWFLWMAPALLAAYAWLGWRILKYDRWKSEFDSDHDRRNALER